jgi:hypothetical protein
MLSLVASGLLPAGYDSLHFTGRFMSKSFWYTLPLLLVALVAGCGKSYNVAPVSGRVTLDGHPLAHAQIRFLPTGGEDLPPSFGVTDDDGSYELHLLTDGSLGAIVGENHVTISKDEKNKEIMMEAVGRMMKSGGRMSRPGDLVPAKYNRRSELSCNVPPSGKTDANFDLKSK